MHSPQKPHLEVRYRVMKYLKGSPNSGNVSTDELNVIRYRCADAD